MLVYYLVPGKLRNLILFLGSLIFYAWGEPVYVVLMLFSSVFNYYMGTELERLYDNDRKQKHNLIFAILVNLGILVFFKYYGFLLNTIGGIAGIEIPHPELSLPIGLSFYTFRNLSYLFDIYMSKIYAQRSFLTFAVYSTMFPYTSAGPIVRYADIEEQLNRRSVNITRFGIGAEFFSQTDFGALGHYLGTLFGIGARGFADSTALYYLKTGLVLFLISIFACRPGLYRWFRRLIQRRPMTAVVLNLLLLALSVAYMVYNSYTPFLYAKF